MDQRELLPNSKLGMGLLCARRKAATDYLPRSIGRHRAVMRSAVEGDQRISFVGSKPSET
jgi:hypothetical protein